MNPVNVVCTLAAPTHSGATLLGLILGAQQGVTMIDEACYFEQAYRKNACCSDGTKVRESEFWKPVIVSYNKYIESSLQLGGEHPSDLLSQLKPNRTADFPVPNAEPITTVTGLNRIKQYFARDFHQLFPEHVSEQYQEKYYGLFRAVLANTGGHTIVDTSKGVWRTAVLRASKTISLKIIVLFRDGKSVVVSQMRKSGERGRLLDRCGVSVAFRTVRWRLYMSMLTRFLGTLAPNDYHAVNFEDLARDPLSTLQGICDFADIPFDAETIEHDSSKFFARHAQHICTGQMPHLKSLLNIKKIQPVSHKEEQLSPLATLIFGMLGGELTNRRFGGLSLE